jgi:hypothetical protein
MSEAPQAKAASNDELTAHYAKTKDLRSLCLRDGSYSGVQIPDACLEGMDLRRTVFQDADLSRAHLVGALAVRSVLTKAKFVGADLRNADLRDAQLNAADLTAADVRGCSFTPETNLNGATIQSLKIDRQALRMLGDRHGGLTAADLAAIEIHDDRVKLTTGFGGFWSLLHLTAATIFLLPYVVFGVRRYVAAQLVPCQEPDCVSLREAIWQYIVTGGQGADVDWVAVAIFGLLLAYNVFRASLVYKVRSLSLFESAVGLPRHFALRGYWWLAYYGCQTLVWLNLLLVLIHAYHFLDTPVAKQ